MNSLAYLISGFMFMIAAAGAVDGTASPVWIAILGSVGILLMLIGIKNQEDD